MNYDILVVGCGFAGAVLAERLASQCNLRILIVDRRSHIGGNAHDEINKDGILVHKYGPHYFRSNSAEVIDYLSLFTEWHFHDYKILSWTDGCFWQFPINLNTFEQLLGRSSSEEEMKAWLKKSRIDIPAPRNSEELIVSQVGVELYEKFFKNYTEKQWGRSPRELDASVCGRIPIRTNRDNRYINENFQALPKYGYNHLFSKILDDPRIEVRLNIDYRELLSSIRFRHMIYTGAIDEYYGYRLSPLPYRSLRFDHETLEKEFHQPVVQVNYPNDYEYTRIVEIKHATGQKSRLTTIVREYPEQAGIGREPYYPIPTTSSSKLYQEYAALAEKESGVSFVGRLACYRYYNMDQVIAQALHEFKKIAPKLMRHSL